MTKMNQNSKTHKGAADDYEAYLEWATRYLKRLEAEPVYLDELADTAWNSAADALVAYAMHRWDTGYDTATADFQRRYNDLEGRTMMPEKSSIIGDYRLVGCYDEQEGGTQTWYAVCRTCYQPRVIHLIEEERGSYRPQGEHDEHCPVCATREHDYERKMQ